MSVSKEVLAQVMKNAWAIAKRAANQHGGSSKEFFAKSLKIAWSQIAVKVSIKSEQRSIFSKIGFSFRKESGLWEKVMEYGDFKRRTAVRFGRGFITSNQLDAVYALPHSISLI